MRVERSRAVLARLTLDLVDTVHALVERAGQRRVHFRRVVAFDEPRFVSVPGEQRPDVVVVRAPEHRRPGDLVLVQVQNRQHRAVTSRVQEADALPRTFERSGFSLAVTDDTRDEQIRIVEDGAERVHQRIAELTALVDRTGRRRAHVARHTARRRELPEEAPHPPPVLCDLVVYLGVRAFEPHVREHRRTAVTGPGDEQHRTAAVADQTVEVHVEQIQAGRRPPVAEEPRLDVLGRERLGEQRIVLEVDLADRQVVRGAPGDVHQTEIAIGKRRQRHQRPFIGRPSSLRSLGFVRRNALRAGS